MNQIIDFTKTRKILCHYRNDTNKIQVIKIIDNSKSHFERTVLPMSTIEFIASVDDILGVFKYHRPCNYLSQKIPCKNLSVLSQSEDFIAA